MERLLLLLMIIPGLFNGCDREGQEIADLDFEMPTYPGALFDSLMWQQYECPDNEEKTVYEWNWAYEVREILGVDDLDSLSTLSHELDNSFESYASSGSTSYMTTAAEIYAATARFRMLNAYQALAELTAETPLGETDFYYHDYMLWEEIYQEFDDWYEEGGNSRCMELYGYYRQLAEFRTDILLEELAIFSEDDTKHESFVHAKPIQIDTQWLKNHPAIYRWYDYRMLMADRLQRHNISQALCLRTLTYKQVSLYMKYLSRYEVLEVKPRV